MPTARICAECGTELASDAPEGLCPKCLLRRGLESSPVNSTLSPESKTVLEADAAPAKTPKTSAGSESALGTRQSAIGKVHYFGDYELLEEIARGGMGVVYRARQVSLNRTVAVKMILAGQLASQTEVRRFRAEAEAAANLQHPNIVAIHEVGEHEGQHYFSMDYVAGKNLADVMKEQPLSPARLVQCVKTIAEAVHYAHQRGTLHRDLKPQNVLIDANDQPRVTDFGLAKLMTRDSGLTHTGAVMGSPSYMPPEQAAGKQDQIGPQSDVYSLGAILYELITGRPPFRGETTMGTLLQVMEKDPVAPTKLNPLTPPDLETICLKCLEKQPERRYASAREVAEELNRVLNQEPILARRVGGLRKAWNWLTRHPWVIAAIAAFFVMILGFLAYGLWSKTQFLAWERLHPAEAERYAHGSGPRTQRMEGLSDLGIDVVSVLGVTVWVVVYYLNKRRLKGLPVQTSVCLAYGVIGLMGIIFGGYHALRMIDAFIWENYMRTEFMRYFSSNLFTNACLSLFMVCHAIHEYQRSVLWARLGAESKLTDEQTAQIKAAVLSGQSIDAVNLYREFTGTGFSQANFRVNEISIAAFQQHPEQLKANVRTRRLWVGASVVIAFVVLGLISLFLAPDWRVAFFLGGVFTMPGMWILTVFWKAMRRGGRIVAAVLCATYIFFAGQIIAADLKMRGNDAPVLLGVIVSTPLWIGTIWLAHNKKTKPVAPKASS